MGISSTKATGNAKKDAGNAPRSQEQHAGQARTMTLAQWRVEIEHSSNRQGKIGDFFTEVTGKEMKRSDYGRIAQLMASFPGGIPALMSAICEAAIRDVSGDPFAYVKKLSMTRKWSDDVSSRKEDYDQYVEK